MRHFMPMVVLALHIVTRAESYGDADAIRRHLADFPYDAPAFPEISVPAATVAEQQRRLA